LSAPSPSSLLRFASFEVNLGLGELRRHGFRIKIQEKPFQILAALLERPGELLTREELHQRLWPENTFFDFDHNLNNAMNKLREALNDSSEEPKYIETLPRRGYRFIASIEEFAAPASHSRSDVSLREAPVVLPAEPASCLPVEASPSPSPRTDRDALPAAPRLRLAAGLAVSAVLLTLGIIGAFRFFALAKQRAQAAGDQVPPITSILIEKNGAIDPVNEGFKIHYLGDYDTAVVRNSLNYGFDRWKLTSNDQAYYYRTLSGPEKEFAATHDWKLTCVCAVQAGGAGVDIDLGPRRFDIELLREGNKYFVGLPVQISPELEYATKIEFPGAGDPDHPHNFELRFDHASQTASLWIDNRLVAYGYRGHSQYLEDRGLMLGTATYLAFKTGIAVFRSVRFEAR
jgi:DNA-binding winged helix-turn-helix (wHTH) protein